jgi:predicted Zn-dependent protease
VYLRTFFIDSYYARKLGAPPTTQAASNSSGSSATGAWADRRPPTVTASS